MPGRKVVAAVGAADEQCKKRHAADASDPAMAEREVVRAIGVVEPNKKHQSPIPISCVPVESRMPAREVVAAVGTADELSKKRHAADAFNLPLEDKEPAPAGNSAFDLKIKNAANGKNGLSINVDGLKSSTKTDYVLQMQQQEDFRDLDIEAEEILDRKEAALAAFANAAAGFQQHHHHQMLLQEDDRAYLDLEAQLITNTKAQAAVTAAAEFEKAARRLQQQLQMQLQEAEVARRKATAAATVDFVKALQVAKAAPPEPQPEALAAEPQLEALAAEPQPEALPEQPPEAVEVPPPRRRLNSMIAVVAFALVCHTTLYCLEVVWKSKENNSEGITSKFKWSVQRIVAPIVLCIIDLLIQFFIVRVDMRRFGQPFWANAYWNIILNTSAKVAYFGILHYPNFPLPHQILLAHAVCCIIEVVGCVLLFLVNGVGDLDPPDG